MTRSTLPRAFALVLALLLVTPLAAVASPPAVDPRAPGAQLWFRCRLVVPRPPLGWGRELHRSGWRERQLHRSRR